jgi:hypothetical protein
LLERHVSWFHDQCRFGGTRILGKGSFAHAEHLVARFELGHVLANRFNVASDINAESCDLWFAQPGHHAKEVRRASHEAPVVWVDGSRVDSYQDFIVSSRRLFNLFTLENIG